MRRSAMSDEEMVRVALGDDYYTGAFFNTTASGDLKDYVVPRSQLERWKAARVAYEAMQAEVETVMREQVERYRARHPKTVIGSILEELYKPAIISALQAPATFRRMTDGESE